jgi:hypothetical protein
MRLLTLTAYLRLVQFDFYIIRGDFEKLYRRVRREPVRKNSVSTTHLEQICSAMDMACIWYWKEVRCLQRSAATACLLRKFGIPGEMVIGAQQLPFQAHAWVEVNGRVVNDKPYIPDIYAVLERL